MYKTSITKIENGKESIRGHDLQELTKEKSFVETIFLLLKGTLPNEKETRMLNSLLTVAIDHGPGTVSAQTARITASAKNSVHTSVAAGILGMGERHGSAIEGAADFFQKNKNTKDLEALLKELKEKKVRIPGYGHAVLEEDHRSSTLFAIAKEEGFFGVHCEFSQQVHEALNAISSKKLPINIDGSMAAILSDMEFAPEHMKGFFIIARVPGLVAQVHEEMANDVGIRRLPEDQIQYE